ncbi:hypothetical protein BVRB_7g166060 [Beta vulgaris subsp. vulgaris]|nr:hypothetical protein BVRB_7g166060 [Beta vulgaris subsp. vulgaris]
MRIIIQYPGNKGIIGITVYASSIILAKDGVTYLQNIVLIDTSYIDYLKPFYIWSQCIGQP